jgi:hypothetical protein
LLKVFRAKLKGSIYENFVSLFGIMPQDLSHKAYFEPSEVGDCFAEELMADIPDDQRCLKFAYLVVENYISPDSMFPPPMWSAQLSAEAKRTTIGAESFHAHFNEQINSGPPCIFV